MTCHLCPNEPTCTASVVHEASQQLVSGLAATAAEDQFFTGCFASVLDAKAYITLTVQYRQKMPALGVNSENVKCIMTSLPLQVL